VVRRGERVAEEAIYLIVAKKGVQGEGKRERE
jgi:hypothetical protein